MFRLYYERNQELHRERMRKIAYCNNEVIPLLNKNKIEYDDYDARRIIIRGRIFPISSIDNGDVEKFIQRLIDKKDEEDMFITRQSSLNEF